MTFERLWISKGALNDAELGHLLPLVLEDPAILEVARQIAENARVVRTEKGERDYNLSDDLSKEVRRLALSVYPHSNPQDWRELVQHVNRYGAQRWLSDLTR